MEILKIRQFLSSGCGNGYGYGYGCGNGNGNGIKSINGMNIYMVDGIPTIFTNIHGNVAKGYVLENKVMLKPCYIVKGYGFFAHGETLRNGARCVRRKKHRYFGC